MLCYGERNSHKYLLGLGWRVKCHLFDIKWRGKIWRILNTLPERAKALRHRTIIEQNIHTSDSTLRQQLNTILKCLWVLCSSAIEYYAQVPLSTILKCHWILCSSAIEYYAIYGIECYLWIRLWVHEIIFLLKTSYFIAPKNDVAI